jgi:hypothetical protein
MHNKSLVYRIASWSLCFVVALSLLAAALPQPAQAAAPCAKTMLSGWGPSTAYPDLLGLGEPHCQGQQLNPPHLSATVALHPGAPSSVSAVDGDVYQWSG